MRSHRTPKVESYNAQYALRDTLIDNGIPANITGVCAGGTYKAIEMALKYKTTRAFDDLVYIIHSSQLENPNPDNNDHVHKELARLNSKYNNNEVIDIQNANRSYNPFLLKIFKLQEQRAKHARQQARLKSEAKKKQIGFVPTGLHQHENDQRFEDTMFDAQALLNQIQIFNSPNYYEEMFGKYLDQQFVTDIASIASHTVQSNGSQHSDDIIENTSWIGLHDQQDLENMFTTINEARASKDGHEQSLAFMMRNQHHEITVIYQNERWHLTDLNKMPTTHYRNDESGLRQLSKDIREKLSNPKSKYTALAISSYTTRADLNETNTIISQLRKSDNHKAIQNKSYINLDPEDKINLAILAVRNNDEVMLRKLIKDGLDVNGLCLGTTSLLSIATTLNNLHLVRLLLKEKADINFKQLPDNDLPLEGQVYSQTALMYAILNEYYDLAIYLLRHGANPNIPRSDTFFPIHMAINRHNLSLVQELINHGAKINPKSEYESPLNGAKSSGLTEITAYLMKAKKDKLAARAAAKSRTDSTLATHSSLFKSSQGVDKKQNYTHDKESIPTPDLSSAHTQPKPSHSAKLYSSKTQTPKADGRIHRNTSSTAPQAAAAYTGADDSSSSHLSDSDAKTDGHTKRK